MIKIILPYPPSVLNPNRRCHWGASLKAKKLSKEAGFYAAKEIPFDAKKHIEEHGKITMNCTFHPIGRHGQDADNALSSLKWALDGVAKAWGVNDKFFRPIPEIGEPMKNPCVILAVKI